MHNSLAGLSARTLLDANVLLDAAFVNGLARASVLQLRSLGFNPLIDEVTLNDAQRIVEGLSRKLGLQFDAQQYVNALIADQRIFITPPGIISEDLRVINRADRPLIAAARTHGTWLLTSDIPLIVEAQGLVQARLPWDVTMGAREAANEPLTADGIVRIVQPTPHEGSIFARISPTGWAGMRNVGEFTACDVESLGRLYYDSGTEEWVFSTVLGVTARVHAPIAVGETWAACGSYKLPGRGKRGTVFVRAGRYPSTALHSEPQSTLKTFANFGRARVALGHTLAVDKHLNGALRALVIGPQSISRDTWRAIMSIPEGAPNPYDANRLRQALALLGTTPPSAHKGLIELPTDDELNRFG